jgi:hypothetical protein
VLALSLFSSSLAASKKREREREEYIIAVPPPQRHHLIIICKNVLRRQWPSFLHDEAPAPRAAGQQHHFTIPTDSAAIDEPGMPERPRKCVACVVQVREQANDWTGRAIEE